MRTFIRSLIYLGVAATFVSSAQAAPTLKSVIDSYQSHLDSKRTDIAEDGTYPKSFWPDVTPEGEAGELKELNSLLADLEKVDTKDISEDDQLNYDILKTILEAKIARAAFDESRLPFTGDWGFHSALGFSISRMSLKSVDDETAILEKLNAIPEYVDAHIANMKRGLKTGFVSYRDPLDTVVEQIEELVAQKPEDSPLYAPFKTLPSHFSDNHAERSREMGKKAVMRAQASLQKALTFLKEEYQPKTREKAGVVDFPDAKAYYKTLVAYHTTLPDMTPEKVHEIGKAEVARIRGEMEAIMKEVKFEGTFTEFLEFLRTDPQFYAKTPEELMARAARYAKDIDYQMPKFFGHLPRLPYGVEPVPAHIAPGYTTGRYVGGSLKDGKAGIYWVNTYALDQRPLYELPSLTAHEAVPGHHHQISIAQELENVPAFRQSYYATAFGEGWGLYSESLASEMGLYKTPYERFGKLSYEMWRACRLVADTGMHWYGWTRAEAETCFKENSALAPLNIKTEVTRYIGWPGQALGYKIGELKIKELRARAENALGTEFDIREFHDKVLEKGALPLAILEKRIDAWIAEKTKVEE